MKHIAIIGSVLAAFVIVSFFWGTEQPVQREFDTIPTANLVDADADLIYNPGGCNTNGAYKALSRISATPDPKIDLDLLNISVFEATSITIPGCKEEVSISQKEITYMSVDELNNLNTLLQLVTVIGLSQSLTCACGQKLLPRFFGKPEGE